MFMINIFLHRNLKMLQGMTSHIFLFTWPQPITARHLSANFNSSVSVGYITAMNTICRSNRTHIMHESIHGYEKLRPHESLPLRYAPEREARQGPETSAHDGVDNIGARGSPRAARVDVSGAHVPSAVHSPQIEGAAGEERLVLPVGGQLLRQAESSLVRVLSI